MPEVAARWKKALNDLIYVEFDKEVGQSFIIVPVAGRTIRIKMMKLAAHEAAEATVTFQSWDGAAGTQDWDCLVHRVEGGLWSPFWKTYYDSKVGEGIRLLFTTTDVSGWIGYVEVPSGEE